MDSRHLCFVHMPSDRTTEVQEVRSISTGGLLGKISWYGPWRAYCFFPVEHTVWSKGCMQEVLTKIAQMMAARSR